MIMKYFVNDLPKGLELEGSIAIDTEAMGLHYRDRDRLCVVQICDESGEVYLVHFPASKYDYSCPNLRRFLTDPNRQKIFHYARFDVAIMRKYLNIDKIENIFCTKIASRFARTYTDSHSLKALVSEILKVDLRKEQQCSYWGADELTDAQKGYAANDVLYLHRLRDALTDMLKKSGRYEIACKYFAFVDNVCTSDIMGFEEDLFRCKDEKNAH
ncbi:MAG: ribonuclease D [Rickettsiales bacterium]|nr:ribonuclease D [Rickettsiales bacterium]